MIKAHKEKTYCDLRKREEFIDKQSETITKSNSSILDEAIVSP
jgi:chaperonin cofactor prefoldin